MAVIDAISFLSWLQKKKDEAARDAEEYRRRSDQQQKENCEHRAVAFQQVIDKIQRGLG